MLPIELESINRGLKFGEKKYDDATYTGYFTFHFVLNYGYYLRQKEGAGVTYSNGG